MYEVNEVQFWTILTMFIFFDFLRLSSEWAIFFQLMLIYIIKDENWNFGSRGTNKIPIPPTMQNLKVLGPVVWAGRGGGNFLSWHLVIRDSLYVLNYPQSDITTTSILWWINPHAFLLPFVSFSLSFIATNSINHIAYHQFLSFS